MIYVYFEADYGSDRKYFNTLEEARVWIKQQIKILKYNFCLYEVIEGNELEGFRDEMNKHRDNYLAHTEFNPKAIFRENEYYEN